MKKRLFALLVIIFLFTTSVLAETVEFDGFAVDIPDGFIGAIENKPTYSIYTKSDQNQDINIKFFRYDNTFSSLDDAVSQIAGIILADYKYEKETINGSEIAIVSHSKFEGPKGIVLAAGSYYYVISCDKPGSWSFLDVEKWNSFIESIVVTEKPIVPQFETQGESQNELNESQNKEETYDYPTLEKGSKGDEVKALQQRLVDLYWLDGSVDGDYGNKTKDAIERFQEAIGLSVTGIADGKTQAKLFADDAPEAEMSVSCSSIVMGNYGQTVWNVNGQSFTLTGNQTKTLKTPWGTYKFDARGEYSKIG